MQDIDKAKHYLKKTLELQAIKTETNKSDYIKLRSLCTAKEIINKTKKTTTGWEKMFANYATDRHLISRICKELNKHNNNKANNSIKKNEQRR